MATLKAKIKNDITQYMRSRDETGLNVLRLLIAAIQNLEIEKQIGDLSDDNIVEVIQRQVKQRREAIALYQKGNRLELADKEAKDIEILNNYLPQQLTSEELTNIVNQVVGSLPDGDNRNFGLVMKKVMELVKGRADGSMVAGLVKQKTG